MIPNRSWLSYFLLLGILIILSVLFYKETITYFPSHIHAWTQSDRYAIALKFLENGFNLFKPQTFNLQTVDGVTAVDLPLNEWLVAMWMKVLGSKAPIIFRLHTLLISFIGYIFLFRTVKLLSQSDKNALLTVIFVFTCPVITYYQAGFVPSVVSLSIFFCGFLFVVQYWTNNQKRELILGVGLLVVAALIRKPFIIFLFALLLHRLYQLFKGQSLNRSVLIIFGVGFLLFISLQVYNVYLSRIYGSMFLNELMPARSFGEFKEILYKVYDAWKWQYFTVFHYVTLILSIVLAFGIYLRKRTIDTLILKIAEYSVITLLGGITYFFLMARQFLHHEYYFIDSLYVGLFLLFIAAIAYIPSSKPITYWGGAGLIICLLVGAVFSSYKVQEEKYSVIDRGETTRKNFIDSEEWLDQQGIPRDAKMLVLDAYSTNAPLILMNRNGYTVLITRDSTIRKALEYEFDYVVIQDEFIPSEVVSPYPDIIHQFKRMSGNGKISLFTYEPVNALGTLEELLGIKPENIRFSDTLDFSIDSLPNWDFQVEYMSIDTNMGVQNNIGLMNESATFGPTYIKSLPELQIDRLLFKAEIEKLDQTCNGRIAVSILNGDDLVFYQDYTLDLYHDSWQDVQFMFKLPAYILAESTLKCYFWNPDRCNWNMDNLIIIAYKD